MNEYSRVIACRVPRSQKQKIEAYAARVGCSTSDLFRAAVKLVLQTRATQPNNRQNVLQEIATLLDLGPDATAAQTIQALEALVAELEAETGGPGADALAETADPQPMKLGKKCTRTHCAGGSCSKPECTFGGSTAALRALTRASSFAPDESERAQMAGMTELQRDRYVALRLARKRDLILKGKAHS